LFDYTEGGGGMVSVVKWSEIAKEQARLHKKTKISSGLWVRVSFDRTKPTLILYDNTSFIELRDKDIRKLKDFLTEEVY
jgi:hypothetical protein